MNYPRNRTHWKPGALVIHDYDAKRPDMLMRVVNYTADGRCRTEYVYDDKATRRWKQWGRGEKSKLVNPLAVLHGAARFGLKLADRRQAAGRTER